MDDLSLFCCQNPAGLARAEDPGPHAADVRKAVGRILNPAGPPLTGGPGTARHFVHFSKMVSILRPGEELSGEGYPLPSEPADGQNTSQSSDPIPEAGG
jgi:hypothetical protein